MKQWVQWISKGEPPGPTGTAHVSALHTRRDALSFLGGVAATTLLGCRGGRTTATATPPPPHVDVEAVERLADNDTSWRPPLMIDVHTHVYYRDGAYGAMLPMVDEALRGVAGSRSALIGRK